MQTSRLMISTAKLSVPYLMLLLHLLIQNLNVVCSISVFLSSRRINFRLLAKAVNNDNIASQLVSKSSNDYYIDGDISEGIDKDIFRSTKVIGTTSDILNSKTNYDHQINIVTNLNVKKVGNLGLETSNMGYFYLRKELRISEHHLANIMQRHPSIMYLKVSESVTSVSLSFNDYCYLLQD